MVRIGKIVATHGLQGQIILTHVVGSSDWLSPDRALLVELRKDSRVPFFVVQAKSRDDQEYLVQFEDVRNVEAARKLVGKAVYADPGILAGRERDTPLLWIGFNIVDKTVGGIGVIEDVMQAGPQWLARITYQQREVLIPLIDSMILDLNTRNRYIRMDLPDGLLDL